MSRVFYPRDNPDGVENEGQMAKSLHTQVFVEHPVPIAAISVQNPRFWGGAEGWSITGVRKQQVLMDALLRHYRFSRAGESSGNLPVVSTTVTHFVPTVIVVGEPVMVVSGGDGPVVVGGFHGHSSSCLWSWS